MGGIPVSSTTESTTTRDLLQRVGQGDQDALGRLLAEHGPYLEKVIALRMDPRLRARVEPGDVLQQANLEAVRRMGDYLAREPMPFRVWLRMTACQVLVDLERFHIHAERRAVRQEAALPDAPSFALAEQLMANTLSPSRKLMRREAVQHVRDSLARLREEERELVLLRNYEGLSNQEAAAVLGIEPAAASKRYGRALIRLHALLKECGLTDSRS
jgi:RNA polymerase sigma-70 factor (ECF subfamily)